MSPNPQSGVACGGCRRQSGGCQTPSVGGCKAPLRGGSRERRPSAFGAKPGARARVQPGPSRGPGPETRIKGGDPLRAAR